jgi:hypothetical protein
MQLVPTATDAIELFFTLLGQFTLFLEILTPLHLAAALGHLAIAQILIWVRGEGDKHS